MEKNIVPEKIDQFGVSRKEYSVLLHLKIGDSNKDFSVDAISAIKLAYMILSMAQPVSETGANHG